ncbi:MAG: carbonic anhydrase family protein [Campylobacterales bacterium]|jgi:carbonic anhydrase
MNKTVMTITSALLTSSISLLASSHWGYTGHNAPQNWGNISPKYAICSTGKNQSPINITSSFETNLEAIDFNYATAGKEILNNGHTVQVNVKDGNSITIDGVKYKLLQVHFHTPSENNIDGNSFPLEAHFVHIDKDGNLAVVAVMFKDGKENAQLAKLWKYMPMKVGEKHPLVAELQDINKLLPENKDYYRFNGSLTTPPCSEGVKWMVLSTPLTISKEQVEKFSHAVHGTNNRPVQDINARIILK